MRLELAVMAVLVAIEHTFSHNGPGDGAKMSAIAPRNRFVDFVRHHAAAAPELPAVRITNVVDLERILDRRTVVPNEQGILYLFYGKPSFKIKKKASIATKVLGDAAVCFVFDLSSLGKIHRIFAFDTGGYNGERYDTYLPRGVALDDFELPADPYTPGQLVSAFFGTNSNYYNGIAKKDLVIPALDSVSGVYLDLINSTVSEDFDERACTCELQFSNAISLRSSKLVTIIIPSTMYDDPEVRHVIKEELGVKPILYRFKRAKPEDRTEVVYEKLGEFYETNTLIEVSRAI